MRSAVLGMSYVLRPFRSIRGRLTVWLATLILVGMVTLALYFYVAIATVLTGTIDQSLRVQAQQVASTYDFGGPEGSSDATGQHVDIGAVDQFATAGLFVETFDSRGHLLARSQNLGGLHLPDETRASAFIHAPPQFFTRSVPGGSLRVYSLPAVRGGSVVGLVLLASSLDQVKATTQALLVWLVVGGLCIVFLVAVGVTVLVRNGLRPLNEMATVAEDITAQRLDQRLSLDDPPAEVARLAQTFDAMLQRLDEAFATQRRFVADASHELRTPLAALQGRSELLLLNPTLDAETRAGLNMLRDEAARMGRMVANLLLVAQGDERHKLDLRPVELDNVLLQVAQHAYTLTAGTQIQVTLHQEDRAEVLGDADLLKQALLNLVDNALTHMPQGGRLALSLSVSAGMALVSVSDTGHGIAATHLPHLFERFYRVDPARSRRNGGAGLGLSIVQWIAEAHGGRVGVESRIGHGSVFTMTLPLSDHTLTDS